MQLIVAEKPSVARDLARVLGVRPSGEHCFEGADRVITWCVGHLVELDEPAAYDPRWRAWRLDTLPMLPGEFRLRPARHAAAQLRAVTGLLRDRRFGSVVNACDAGREGELIFRYLYGYAGARLPVQRLWISSLTDDAIRRGFAALRPGAQLDALGDAARSRSEADWLVGMNATRAITARGRGALYSIGRVQTPTLAMLVAREQAIRAFVPRDYWEVRGDFVTAGGERFSAGWRHGKAARLGTEALAAELVARDAARGAAADPLGPRVERVRARTVREPPPLLFDLTSLQRTANRRFGLSAARTLEVAQALYERHKLLTYPRTDSRHLSSDVAGELPAVFRALAGVPDYAAFASQRVAHPPRPNRRVFDDARVSDHHAIIPTARTPSLPALDRDERRILDLVVRRFLGAFFPDAELALTEVWIRVGGPAAVRADAPARAGADPDGAAPILDQLPPPPDRYLARGRVRLVAGWQEVTGLPAAGSGASRREGVSTDEEEEARGALPALVEGQPLDGAFARLARQTVPPPRYSEATLLAAMESAGKAIDDEVLRAAMKDRGLGTAATRASIIETLLRREYIARDRQHLVPTATGLALIAALPVASLASPELTGAWEARLARIARGEDSRAAFMADIARYVVETVDAIRGAAPPAASPAGPIGGGATARRTDPTRQELRAGRRGRSDRGSGAPPPRSRTRPRRSRAPRNGAASRAPRPTSRSRRPDEHPSATPSRRSDEAASTTRSRRSDEARHVADAVAELACPRCREGRLIAGARGWGCSRWREGCKLVVWFETAGRRLTAAQLRDLVTRGKTRKARFAPDGARAPVDGRLVLDPGADGARFEPS